MRHNDRVCAKVREASREPYELELHVTSSKLHGIELHDLALHDLARRVRASRLRARASSRSGGAGQDDTVEPEVTACSQRARAAQVLASSPALVGILAAQGRTKAAVLARTRGGKEPEPWSTWLARARGGYKTAPARSGSRAAAAIPSAREAALESRGRTSIVCTPWHTFRALVGFGSERSLLSSRRSSRSQQRAATCPRSALRATG
jgi:hypothetical protein